MKLLGAFVVLVLAVEVYSNCGCLKCSKNLNVYSPRGSGLKIIYKNTPCSCLTGIPYSVQVPVQRPRAQSGRSYGYRVQEESVPEPDPCPLEQEYNVQLQVPQSRPAPSYLVGLVAKTDRVLISGPPEPLPAPGCPRAIFERVQVGQGNSGGDGSDNLWYYGNSARSGCGCLRYGRKIRKVPLITPNTPLFNLQLLQRHSYSPPKTKLKANLNSDMNTINILNSQGQNFYRIPISELPQERFTGTENFENENSDQDFYEQQNPNNPALNCRERFQIVRINPGIVRIYRRVFCQPSPKNSGNGRTQNFASNELDSNPRSPNTYQQVFLKSQPKLFRVSNPNFGKKRLKVNNSDLTSQKPLYQQRFEEPNVGNKGENLNSDWHDRKRLHFEKLSPNSGQKFLGYGPNSVNIRQQFPAPNFDKDSRTAQNSDTNFPENPPKRVQSATVLLRNKFPENSKVQNSEPGSKNSGILGSKNVEAFFNTVNQPQNSIEIRQNFQENPANGPNSETLQKPLRYNAEKQNPKENSDTKIDNFQNFDTKTNPKINNIQAEKFSFNTKQLYNILSQNSAQTKPQAEPSSEQNLQNLQENSNSTKALPKNYHIIKSHQLLLTEGNSGPNTVFFSTTQQIGAISDSLLAETLDSILSKKENRPKRSINWKMLALKPENPPRYLRTHSSVPSYFRTHRNEEETSRAAPRRSLIEKLRRIHSHEGNHGRTPFHHGAKHAHGINPLVHGGRHSIYSTNPSVHGGRHSLHVRKPLGDAKRSSRLPRENKRKKKVQLKKKKSNVMLKSAWKRTNKIIKDWFSKESPLSAPEIQLPTYEPSNAKRPMVKHLSRHKRRIKDDGLLPFFSFLDDTEKVSRKTIKDQKHVQQVHNSKPTEDFLEPLNYKNIFHPTPILHLLNTPIRCLNHFHKLRSHVSPVVGTIPKVIQVSRRYVIGLLRNFGRKAIHLGSNFVKGFTKLKKSKLLPKRRHRRSLDPSEDDPDETSDHPFSSEPETAHYDREEDEWEAAEGDGESLPSKDEAWTNSDRHPSEDNEEANSGREQYSYQESEKEGWGVSEDGQKVPSRNEAWKNGERHPSEDNEEINSGWGQYSYQGSDKEGWGVSEDSQKLPSGNEAWKNNKRHPYEDNEEPNRGSGREGGKVGEDGKKLPSRDEVWKYNRRHSYEDKEETNSGRNQHSYQGNEREEWGVGESIDEETEPKHEDWDSKYNEDEIVDKVLSKILAQKEFQDLVAKLEDRKLPNSPEDKPLDGEEYTDTEPFVNGKRRKRDIEEGNDKQTQTKTHHVDNIFMGLLNLLMGIGNIQENKELDNPKHQNETNSSDESLLKEELVENIHRYEEIKKMKGDTGDDYGKVSDFPLKPRVVLLDSDSNIEHLEPTEETGPQNILNKDSSTTIVVREDNRKSEIHEMDTGKIENSENEPKGSINIWKKVLDASGEKKLVPALGEARELHVNNARPKTDIGKFPEVESGRRKRAASNGPVFISSNMEKHMEKVVKNQEKSDMQTKILKVTKEATEILSQASSKPSHPSELDVQVQTIKDKIDHILTNIETLLNYDFSKQLDVYQGLLKLQAVKSDIVRKWRALILDNNPEDDAKKTQLLLELKEAQDLKGLIFQEVAQRMNNQESLFRGNWIKILVRLQKLHCVVKNLHQRLDDHDFNIGFLESLDLVSGNTPKAILASLKRDQEDKLEAQIELAENLGTILNRNEGDKIKEAARIIWEINNVEKLQKVSIVELNQKISHGLKIRKELKILFDLQKQVEQCEQQQKVLMAEWGKNSALESGR